MRKFFSALVGIVVIAVMLTGCAGTATTTTTKPVSPATTTAAPPPASTTAVAPTSTTAAPPASSSAAQPKPPAPATSAPAASVPAASGSGKPYSQYTRTVGLLKNDATKAYPGYTLFSPKHMTHTYLIDMNGQVVNEWKTSVNEPGQSFYLRDNGNLVRAAMTRGPLSSGGGEGGRVEEYDWSGKLVWFTDFSTANYMQHHDITLLPNGNLLLMVVVRKTYEEAVQAGFNPKNLDPQIKQQNYMVPDSIYEVKPKMPSGCDIVWEWHTWDHMVQNFDKTKDNYGIPTEHPELCDVNGDHKLIPAFWNHMNSVTYNAKWDQIMLSVRGNSEIWIIDHSTTTAQAKEHSGGTYNKGGDILYRWGNPQQYDRGTSKDQTLFQQHNAIWIDDNLPGAGDIMVFNNGLGRGYSTCDQWTPPVDSKGNYTLEAGKAYGPTTFSWTWKDTPPTAMFDEAISGSQRLANGNTLIDSGVHGRFIEVTAAGEKVWEYINPVSTGPMGYADPPPADPARGGEFMNACFRVLRYGVDFPGFKGKDMTPKGVIETDTPPKTVAARPQGGAAPPPQGGMGKPPEPGDPGYPTTGAGAAPAPGAAPAAGAAPGDPGLAPTAGPNTGKAIPPKPASSGKLVVTSTAVKEAGNMPDKHTRTGAKAGLTTVSPPIAWSGAPAGAKSFVVILNGESVDALEEVHWILYNIPGTTASLAEGVTGVGTVGQAFITPSEGAMGTYKKTITVYALSADITVAAADKADVTKVRAAMEGKILDTGVLNYEFTVG